MSSGPNKTTTDYKSSINSKSVKMLTKYPSPVISASSKTTQEKQFLQQAFDMITSCPNDIASWSLNGSTIIIKNSEKLASTIIPIYFKHSNFASFVRQLNIYGFRKLRLDSARNPMWSEFAHPLFQRDHPENISLIKKQTEKDFSEVRDQVNTLAGAISDLQSSIASLTDKLNSITVASVDESSGDKKRKVNNNEIEAFPIGISSIDNTLLTGPDLTSFKLFDNELEFDPNWDNTIDILMEEENLVADLVGTKESTASITSDITSSPSNSQFYNLQDLSKLINTLSPDMQALFVEKLAAQVGSQFTGLMNGKESMNQLASSMNKIKNTTLICDNNMNKLSTMSMEQLQLQKELVKTMNSMKSMQTHTIPQIHSSPRHIHRDTIVRQELIEQTS